MCLMPNVRKWNDAVDGIAFYSLQWRRVCVEASAHKSPLLNSLVTIRDLTCFCISFNVLSLSIHFVSWSDSVLRNRSLFRPAFFVHAKISEVF